MEKNKIELSPGQIIKINYEIYFQNTKLENANLDLVKLAELIKKTTKENIKLYCWIQKQPEIIK